MKLIAFIHFFFFAVPSAAFLLSIIELTDLIKKLFMYILTQLIIYFLIALAAVLFVWAFVYLWIERIEFKRSKRKPEMCKVADEILDMDLAERFLIDRKWELKVVRKKGFFKKAI